MRIDAHQHFWQYQFEQYPWIDEKMARLRGDFLPAQLSPLLIDNNFSGCVAVQARQSEEETQWLLALGAEHSQILGVVGWIDLCSAQLPEQLSKLQSQPLLKGFRHVLQDELEIDYMLRPEFIRGIKWLAEFDYSYDLLVTAQQLPLVCQLLEQLPKMRLVLDHVGKPDIKAGGWQQWAQCITTLAKHQHLHCKVSGLVTEADWQHWSVSDFEPYLAHVLSCFGAKRLMFGSDWPVCLVAANYTDSVSIIEQFITSHAPQDLLAVMGENAAMFYQLSGNRN